MSLKQVSIIITAAQFLCALACAQPTPVKNADELKGEGPLAEAVRTEIAKKWPAASIELTSAIQWIKGFSPEERPVTVSIQEITPRGEAVFVSVDKATGAGASGWVKYAAWIHARVALRRIGIGEKLSEDMWAPQDINAASGMAYEYRGTILNQTAPLAKWETRQTILEGQFLTSGAIQRVPDVRKGDSVRIRMVSGVLSVSTQGIAEESGYLNGRVRVMSSRNKKEFVGELDSDGVVEVQL